MNLAKNILVTLLSLVLLGIVIAYYKPALLKSREFLLGFATFFGLWLIVSLILRLIKPKNKRTEKSTAAYPILLFISFLLLFIANKSFLKEKRNIAQQELLVALTNNQLLVQQNAELTKHHTELITRITKEAIASPDRVLSEGSISQIANLSKNYEPYFLEPTDSIPQLESPERGFLLKSIIGLRLDATTQRKINQSADFSYAKLDKEDLSGLDLSYINLEGAQLKEANLSTCNLAHAKLQNSYLWGSELSNTALDSANFNRANLAWSNLDSCTLVAANFGSADLSNTKLRDADLSNANFTSANLNTAFLNNSSLSKSNFFGADLSGVTLANCNLYSTNFRHTNLNDTKATKAKFTKTFLQRATINRMDLTAASIDSITVVGKNWLSQLNELSVKGTEDLELNFILTPHKTVEDYFIVHKITGSNKN